jgi:hypothetical protein
MDLPHSSTAIWMQMENDFAAERVTMPFLYRCLPFWYGGPKNDTHRRKAFRKLQERLIIYGVTSHRRQLLMTALLCGSAFWMFTRPGEVLMRSLNVFWPAFLMQILHNHATNSFGRSVSRYLGEHPVIVPDAMTRAG